MQGRRFLLPMQVTSAVLLLTHKPVLLLVCFYLLFAGRKECTHDCILNLGVSQLKSRDQMFDHLAGYPCLYT